MCYHPEYEAIEPEITWSAPPIAVVSELATALLINLGALPHDAPADVVVWHGDAAGLIGLVDGLRTRLGR